MNKKLLAVLAILPVVVAPLRADIAAWYSTVSGTADNLVAATGGSGGGQTGANGGGWSFNGTTGITFDYGALGTDSTNFGTVEYIFNLSDSGGSVALGSFSAWGGEKNVMKLEQYLNTGAFGATNAGAGDATFTDNGTGGGTPVASVFNTTTVATFVLSGGKWSLYLDGVFAGMDTRSGGSWIMKGGVGTLGSGNNLAADVANGTILGVASYNRALSATEVQSNYAAFTAVPEPSTYGLLGTVALAGIALVRRRRRADNAA